MSHLSCLTVLLIDDCTVDRMKLRRLLKEDSRYTYRILEFSCAREARQWCQQETPDVILLDFSLPDDNGLELLEELRVTLNNTQSAVIMLTGQGDEAIAVQAMKSGAQDYIVKDKLTSEVLNSAIHYAVERLQLARQLAQSREQQQLIAAIALRIRQSLNLEEILCVTAKEVRQFLGADRVIVYEFQPDMSGAIVAESVVPGWTVTLGKQIQDTCFSQQQVASAYQQGKKLAIDDIYQAGLTTCYLQLLEQFEVKANLVVPIVVADRLWGLLVAHQCSASRQWQTVELDLLEQLAVQIAIAIQQASAYEQLQAQLQERQRTEAALRQNEERLNLALESAGMGNWDWNILTGELHLSPNLELILGMVPGSFNGRYETFVAMIYPSDRELVLQAINRAVYKKQEYQIEFRLVKPDGNLRWAFCKGKVFYDSDGNPTRMMGIDLDITERKQTEAYLGESEERFRNIADNTPVLIWISGVDALCYYFNKTWLNFTGRTFAQELGDGWLEGVHPDDFQHCLDTYINAFEARQNFQMEYRLRRYDGEYRWILDTGVARFTHEGEFLGYMGSCIDITERILAEQALQQINQELEVRVEQRTAALKESEERWHLAVRGSNDGIWDWNIKTNEIFFSTRWQEMRGFAEHEIHYNVEQWLNQIHPDDRDRVLTALSDHLEHKSPLFCEEYRFKCKDGSYIWVLDRGQALWDETGKAIRIAGSGTDITTRKVAEAQLLSITRLQQAILACSDYGIITLNLEGIIQTFNPAAQKMLGYTADEVVGRLTPMIFHDSQELQQRAATLSWQLSKEIPPNLELLTAISQQQQNYEQEWTYIHKDGSRLPVLLSITDLRDANGQIMGLLGIAKDITQQKQMEAKLHQNTAHLTLAQRIAHLGSWEFDFTTQNITWSEEVFRIFRRDPASGAPSYEEFRELIHPEDRLVHDLLVQQTFKYGLSYKDEYRAYRTDGTIIHLLSRGEVIFDESGRPSRLIGTVMDITERKQAEIALRVSQERLQLALEGSGDGLWDWNISTGEAYFSPNFLKMLGYYENELDNDVNTWESLIHPEDKPWVMDRLNAHLQNINAPYAFDYRLLTKTGEWKWIANYGKVVARDRNHAPVRMVGTHKDISNRKHIEQQLQNLSNRLTLALQSGAIATWDWDLIHDCLYWDERMYELYGMQTSQLPVKYQDWVNAVHLEDIAPAEARIQDALRGQKEFTTEFRVIHPDGSIHFIKAAAIVQRDDRGNPTRMVGINYDITERKQIEQALRDSERRYATLAEASPVAIFRFDIDGNCIYVNDRWSEMTGRPIPAAMNMGWLDTLHPDDRDRLVKDWSYACEHKIIYQNEGRCLRPDGSIIWFYIQSLPETDPNNQTIGYIGTLTDITSRKLIEEELLRQKQLQEVIFNESTDALFLVDPQTLLNLDCNLRALEMFEVAEKSELIGIEGRTLQRHPFTATELDDIVVQMQLKGFWSQEIEYVTHKGKFFWGNIAAKQITVAGRNLNLVRVTDISDRKESEQVLAIYTRELADLYNNAPCGYHSLDADGRFVNINHTELQWLGYTYQEIIGKEFTDFITETSRSVFRQQFPKFKQRGWVKDLEFEMVCQDGSILPVLLNATAVKSEDGNYLFSRSSMFDMRDRKQAEEQLRRTNEQLARATRLKDEFLANMSHELRTPLNAILGMSEGFQEGVFGFLNQRQAKAIATIERSGKHLLELINDILDLSKIESGKMELQLSEVSVSSLCDASMAFIKQMALKKNISLSTSIANNIASIQVDDRRLRQALINLLSNAVKFTPDGGSITLEVKLETVGEEIVNPQFYNASWKSSLPEPKSKADLYICFRIIDTGIGIAPENINKLFQPFVQLDSSLNRQYSGTGLGLALVQRIATLHEGTVSVDSEVGRGSCFSICIPYKPGIISPITQVIAPSPSYRLAVANSPVLIIEDSVPAAEQITRYLTEMEMQPIVYAQGEGVIDEVLRVGPVMIFLDIQLPNLSGWDVLKQIKVNPRTKDIPVIIISVVDERTKGMINGACEYLVKPITRAQFQSTIEKVQHLILPDLSAVTEKHLTDVTTPLILLAEDNQANIDTMSGYLESRGYRLLLAKNGQQAIDFAQSQRPDLIVMDIQMPVMDGLEAMRHIREEPELLHVPIIALTALAMSGDRELCLAAGANEYLTKPVKLKQLAIAIQQLLAK